MRILRERDVDANHATHPHSETLDDARATVQVKRKKLCLDAKLRMRSMTPSGKGKERNKPSRTTLADVPVTSSVFAAYGCLLDASRP